MGAGGCSATLRLNELTPRLYGFAPKNCVGFDYMCVALLSMTARPAGGIHRPLPSYIRSPAAVR